MKKIISGAVVIISVISVILICSFTNKSEEASKQMNTIAEKYVKLVLRVGQYAPNYVDAYFGPEEWQPAESNKEDTFPYDKFIGEADDLINSLDKIDDSALDKILLQRKHVLAKQLIAAKTKIEMTNGKKFSFDEETSKLYDAVAPVHTDEYFQAIIDKLDKELPGKGDINTRWENFRKDFLVPEEKLDTVFKTAVKECRKRTLQHFDLPAGESYNVEYVKGQSWGAYNWYKGNSHSLLQVNTDFPIFISRIIDLASHEGYPGHHVRNIMLDQVLYHKNGWVEYSINLLFNPMSPIDEGSANYGIEVAFPGKERIEFEKKVLFPLAGIDSSKAEKYYEISDLMNGLKYTSTEAARKFINNEMSLDELTGWYSKYSLYSPEKAKSSLRFIETYRGYIINYTVGKEVVANYIESNGGTEENPEKRWQLFKELISTPHTVSDLVASTKK